MMTLYLSVVVVDNQFLSDITVTLHQLCATLSRMLIRSLMGIMGKEDTSLGTAGGCDQWRTEGGLGGVQPPSPEIPKF